jgi:hypothetical protein
MGAGAHTIPQYYREILVWAIQHSRDWGAVAAGRSPRSVIRKEDFFGAFMPEFGKIARIILSWGVQRTGIAHALLRYVGHVSGSDPGALRSRLY